MTRVCEAKNAMRYEHIPVLVHDVIEAFHLQRPALVVDGTLGLGGHTQALLQTYPDMRVLAVEWDREALAVAQERLKPFGSRFEAVAGSYADLPYLLTQREIKRVDGLLLDFGLSSFQLADALRGFSFLRPGPLDMRMSREIPKTAWDLLRDETEWTLMRLFQTLGEEPCARRVAAELKRRLTLGTLTNDALEIAQVIRHAIPNRRPGIDPATRCFQALRIAVNHELENVDRILEALPNLLAPRGRAALISFHSLEDRRVKQSFAQAVKGCICPPRVPVCVCGKKPWGKLLQRKAFKASEEEIQENPRSRSARLRVIEALP